MPEEVVSVGTTTRLRKEEAGNAVFIKRPSKLPHVRAIVELAGLSKAEVRFYRELSHEMPLQVPKMVRTHHRRFGFELVLEDLRTAGCELPTSGSALSQDQVKRLLLALAKLHQQFWEDPRFDHELAWLGAQSEREARLSSLSRPLLESGFLQAGALLPRGVHRGLRLYASRRRSVQHHLRRGPRTLTHHDCHPGNVFFTPTGAAGLLDWQLVRTGSWASDVAYLLATALTVADRRAQEDDLIARYLQALPAAIRPKRELAQELIRGHYVYALEAMVLTLGLGPLMPRGNIDALLERTAMAVVDAESFVVLGF